MAQWRRWCLDPDYAAGAERAHDRYAAIRTPMLALSFTDDELMSARSVERLEALYAGAALTRRCVAAADAGVRRIGHFGFFREASGARIERTDLRPIPPGLQRHNVVEHHHVGFEDLTGTRVDRARAHGVLRGARQPAHDAVTRVFRRPIRILLLRRRHRRDDAAAEAGGFEGRLPLFDAGAHEGHEPGRRGGRRST